MALRHSSRPAPSATPTTSRAPSRRWRRLAALFPALCVPLLFTGSAHAATGDLDPTFSGDGIQITTNGAVKAEASVVQSDGKLVVAGSGGIDEPSVAKRGTYVARYDTSGNLDPSYGTGGIAKLNAADGTEEVRGVTIDASGRVLVSGYVNSPEPSDETDIYVIRLTTAGVPDGTFGGGDGVAIVDRTNHDKAGGIAVAGSRILVGAGLDSGGNFSLEWNAVALTTGGNLDTTFSGDGLAPVPLTTWSASDGLRDVAVQADGKLLLGGSKGGEFAVVRLTGNGDMDTSWDGDGLARAPLGSFAYGRQLLVQKDRKVVVAGSVDPGAGTGRDFAVVRWSSGGVLDKTFGGDGTVTVDFGARLGDDAEAAALAPDEKIVLAGSSSATGGMNSAVARLDWDGTLDTSFSGDGLVVTDTNPTSNESLMAVTTGSNGRVVGAGYNLSGWALVGYTGGANFNVSVSDAQIAEPDTATANVTFTVSLSAASPTPVTVRYATANSTAKAPSDYTAKSGALSFAPGETAKTVSVAVVGDTVVEPTEMFTVSLSKPTNAGIADATGIGTIVNDD